LIDEKFNQIERLERELEKKDAIIADLENELGLLLNKKVVPKKPRF